MLSARTECSVTGSPSALSLGMLCPAHALQSAMASQLLRLWAWFPGHKWLLPIATSSFWPMRLLLLLHSPGDCSVGLKGISASLPAACLELPGVSRKESVRGLCFLSASTRRARGSSCPVPPQAHPLAGPTVHPAEGTLSSRRSTARHRHHHRLRHSSSGRAEALGQPRGCPRLRRAVGTDGRSSPGCGERARPRPWARSRGPGPMRFKGSDTAPSSPGPAGAAASLPLAGPAPLASPIGRRPRRPRPALGSDWLLAISRGPRPFSRLRLARARAPAALSLVTGRRGAGARARARAGVEAVAEARVSRRPPAPAAAAAAAGWRRWRRRRAARSARAPPRGLRRRPAGRWRPRPRWRWPARCRCRCPCP